MGRGDKKTRKGKIARGSYGNSRPHKPASNALAVIKSTAPKAKKEKVAKLVAEDTIDETPVVKKTKKTTKKTKEATSEE